MARSKATGSITTREVVATTLGGGNQLPLPPLKKGIHLRDVVSLHSYLVQALLVARLVQVNPIGTFVPLPST